MADLRLLLLLSTFSLLLSAALALSEARQCRLRRLDAVQPRRSFRSEGGSTELWDERSEQFQCAGVGAMRNVLKPKALSLPNYQPYPRLIYIEKGQAVISVALPGCAETFHDLPAGSESRRGDRDSHQKVHRIRRGDVVAIPAGAVHFCYNDGDEELVAVSVNDLSHRSNQLDQNFRAFYLAGGVPAAGKQEEENFRNIFRAFDAELLAEAFNVRPEIIEKMQAEEQAERGLSIIPKEPLKFVFPDEEARRNSNGLEETFCSMTIRAALDNRRDADISSRQAGKLNVVDRNKLAILNYIDMSAEKGNLFPNALLSPGWNMHGHGVVYVTGGAAQVEVADNNGKILMSDMVKEGDMFVVPQNFMSAARAGDDGFEWVSFKTSGWPMRNEAAGYTSVMRAMPVDVLTNAYKMSPEEARSLKMNSGGQTVLMSPRRQRRD
ncbi:11S globulin seed storage protein 2-like [Andrographis paniculata]|uniref:11S globulin seed storage protein 2-like n=1 Tax=Andrographis paniculata TaxID=175694 RepID=UPI0021E92A1B|nr:11S globulin seed storage protein 2-like [Andrographis paniculata]